jgi:hypothetical protein
MDCSWLWLSAMEHGPVDMRGIGVQVLYLQYYCTSVRYLVPNDRHTLVRKSTSEALMGIF